MNIPSDYSENYITDINYSLQILIPVRTGCVSVRLYKHISENTKEACYTLTIMNFISTSYDM